MKRNFNTPIAGYSHTLAAWAVELLPARPNARLAHQHEADFSFVLLAGADGSGKSTALAGNHGIRQPDSA